MTLFIDNKTARRLFLHQHGLTQNPGASCTKSDILDTIETLGFVQVDSIRTVERAHHLILFSRHQTYKHKMLTDLLETDRELFENWTHDASIIPSQFYRYWKHRFKREENEIVARWEKWGRKGTVPESRKVLQHIKKHGPTLARQLKPASVEKKSKPGWWDWHPSKTALEYLWRTGASAICHREGFQKSYDIAERVIKPEDYDAIVSYEEFCDWACSSALERLGFATHGEIAAFWALVKPGIVKDWIDKSSNQLIEVEVQSFDKSCTRVLWAKRDILQKLATLPSAPRRLRVLSPFDPLLRDRKRAEFLFGFRYRIEVFVPQAQREFGYYVFPILEGERIIGRIDMKADRKTGRLNVRRVWLEDKIKWSGGRRKALSAELARIARFSGLCEVNFDSYSFD